MLAPYYVYALSDLPQSGNVDSVLRIRCRWKLRATKKAKPKFDLFNQL